MVALLALLLRVAVCRLGAAIRVPAVLVRRALSHGFAVAQVVPERLAVEVETCRGSLVIAHSVAVIHCGRALASTRLNHAVGAVVAAVTVVETQLFAVQREAVPGRALLVVAETIPPVYLGDTLAPL